MKIILLQESKTNKLVTSCKMIINILTETEFTIGEMNFDQTQRELQIVGKWTKL